MEGRYIPGVTVDITEEEGGKVSLGTQTPNREEPLFVP
jgi:hypothetical protein